MRFRSFLFLLIFLVVGLAGSASFAAAPQRMRPYTGIGLLVFSSSDRAMSQDVSLQLYAEPGLSRVGIFDGSSLSVNEWIFGVQRGRSPLIVSARKGDWLKVFYDDAGREAWVEPQARGRFHTWEQYLKLQTGHMLPGLQPQFYQLQQQPGRKLVATLTPKQIFKVLKLDGAWGMVVADQVQIGWVRWRDDDGRITIGTGAN